MFYCLFSLTSPQVAFSSLHMCSHTIKVMQDASQRRSFGVQVNRIILRYHFQHFADLNSKFFLADGLNAQYVDVLVVIFKALEYDPNKSKELFFK